ncbi:MAG: DUF998 domain-containing protein [Methermicoccaceae archaeon]
MNTISRVSGFIAPVVAFVGITLAIATHPWFSFTENAISDLGALYVEGNYILNISLFVSGILATVFAYGLTEEQRTKLGRFGAILFMMGTISLAMIGLFPEDFKIPIHFIVSVSFFAFAGLGILAMGIADERRWFRAFSILLFSSALMFAMMSMDLFTGVAIPELIGAVAITIWVYVYLLSERSKGL